MTKKRGSKAKSKTGGAAVPPAPAGQANPPQGDQGNQGQVPPNNQQQAYDPANPTEDKSDELLNLAADLKDFLGEHIADVRDELKRDLAGETKRLQRVFDQKVSEEVDYTKKKLLA